MTNIFEFSNWNQLSGLKSKEYPEISIKISVYNHTESIIPNNIIGTKITIYNINTNDIYFTGFIRLVESDLFSIDSCFDTDIMIDIINSYGFNIAYTEPIELPENVKVMLSGLYQLGYNYITTTYSKPDSLNTPYKKYIIATKDISFDKKDVYIISDAPNYNPEDFKWAKPVRIYPIDLLLNPTKTTIPPKEDYSNGITLYEHNKHAGRQ